MFSDIFGEFAARDGGRGMLESGNSVMTDKEHDLMRRMSKEERVSFAQKEKGKLEKVVNDSFEGGGHFHAANAIKGLGWGLIAGTEVDTGLEAIPGYNKLGKVPQDLISGAATGGLTEMYMGSGLGEMAGGFSPIYGAGQLHVSGKCVAAKVCSQT